MAKKAAKRAKPAATAKSRVKAKTKAQSKAKAKASHPVKSSRVQKPATHVKRNAPWVQCVELADGVTLYQGDCTEVMAALDPASVHAVVTDPPYELGFMGKAWDKAGGVASNPDTWRHALAALKPGGHLVAFAGSRTYHRIACAIEDAGFEICDQLMWLYGSGFPKSLDVSKAIDKAAGAKRRTVGKSRRHGGGMSAIFDERGNQPITAPTTDDAKRWDGWGTALKPAHEPIAFARKPLAGTVMRNVLDHGTGALNVDACRAERPDRNAYGVSGNEGQPISKVYGVRHRVAFDPTDDNGDVIGRWPANVMHDGSLDVFEALPPSSRDAFRFFYSAKAGRDEREFGMRDGGVGALRDGDRATKKVANFHPTVKPVDLMRWLIRLTTRPAGVVLEPFMGSGSTGIAAVREGARFVGIERDPDYFEIARRRIAAAIDERERAPALIPPIMRPAAPLQQALF